MAEPTVFDRWRGPVIFVQVGDFHCGSELGLATPEGVQTHQQNWWKPGPHIEWLWSQHLNAVDDASRFIKKYRRKAKVVLLVMGDVVDGDHHNTHQIINRDQGTHVAVARNVLRDGFFQLKPDEIFIVMGTPSHVGPAGGLEKSIAKNLEDEGYPIVRNQYGQGIWKELEIQAHDFRIHAKHHGRAGRREHTRRSYAAIYAFDIRSSFLKDGRVPPDLALRAHNHIMEDTGPDLRGKGYTRVLTSGCWQFNSEWVDSKAFETRPDFGWHGIVVTPEMRDPHDIIARPFLYNPDPDKHEEGVVRYVDV